MKPTAIGIYLLIVPSYASGNYEAWCVHGFSKAGNLRFTTLCNTRAHALVVRRRLVRLHKKLAKEIEQRKLRRSKP